MVCRPLLVSLIYTSTLPSFSLPFIYPYINTPHSLSTHQHPQHFSFSFIYPHINTLHSLSTHQHPQHFLFPSFTPTSIPYTHCLRTNIPSIFSSLHLPPHQYPTLTVYTPTSPAFTSSSLILFC